MRDPHTCGLPAVLFLACLIPAWAAAADLQAPLATFEEANALKDADACAEAVGRYDEVMGAIGPDEEVHALALYNQAVCFETLGRLGAARANYDALLRQGKPTAEPLRRDARFRRALVLIADDQPGPARPDLRTVRRQTSDPLTRAQVDIQLGWIDLQRGRPRTAAHRLKAAVGQLQASSSPGADAPYFLAQGLCGLGDVFLAEASRIGLRRDRRLGQRLRRRAQLMDRALAYYLSAIDQREPTWAAAATLHIGQGFHQAADDLLELDGKRDGGPADDSPDAEVVSAWLSQRIPSLLLKAFEAYNLCHNLGLETGDASRFTQACTEALRTFPTDRLVPEGGS